MEDGLLFLGILSAFFVIMYVLVAFALMTIAQRTATPNSWFAWIPFANIFLMVSIARKEWWWALIIIVLMFIPVIGSLPAIGLLVYIWWVICERLNKPGPLSLLMLVPIANLVFLYYLAFSK